MSLLSNLEETIEQAMLADRVRLQRRLKGIRRAEREGKPFDRQLDKLTRDIERSTQLRESRRQNVPLIRYDDSLPITARRDDIAEAIRQHQVVVVAGETGSGKSTQLPKMCLDIGRGVDGMIGHTQPRRIAARSVASRLADELGSTVGGHVGFKIRFTDVTRPQTYVKLMTDGILLAETQGDRFLEQYDTLIIDEAHERSLNIDFLLGYVKRLLPRRPDLRVIITSATIDAERFAAHFGTSEQPAPALEVSGRTYPVEVRYRPLESDDEDQEDLDLAGGVAAAAAELIAAGPGDILVFLPTEREIRDVAKVLRGRRLPGQTEILPLYARLSTAEQNKVFQSHKHRRIVLATNVAESSLTVPGIRYVIDSGTARISRYAPRAKVQRLPIEAVSRASADQRKGRCGRLGPGICIRLYSEEDFLARDQYTTPEIRRTNLAGVVLQMLAKHLGSIDDFPFLDPPTPNAVRDAYKTLFELGAIDEGHQLTELGRQLSVLPVDPRIGRMILAGVDEGCLHEILIIAAALETQDPRERPQDKQQAADEAHAKFQHEESDFLSYLRLWDFAHQLKGDLSRNQLRKALRANFLSYNRLREWQDVHRQLRQLVEQHGYRTGPRRDDYDSIHRALLSGLLSNIARRNDDRSYSGAGGSDFTLWPGSGVSKGKPKWIVAAELVETSRRFLRTVARINPTWIEPLAPHLVRHSYSDPHWSQSSGTVLAFEKITLFGLTVVAGRRVKYGPVDPELAREIFIQHALVEGQFDTTAGFLEHNRRLLDEIQSMGDKSRSRDFLVPQWTQVAFYEQHLPADVYDSGTLKNYLVKAKRDNPRALFMRREDLLPPEASEVARDAFPDHLQLDALKLDVQYRFQPGEVDDGVTLTVPRVAVNQLPAERLGWLVPGLLEEKLVALIRSLPKALRRALVPAPDTARRAVAELRYGEGPFLESVAEVLSRIADERIPVEAFRLEKLPPHLQMNVRVVDETGETVTEGRDLPGIRRELGAEDAAAGGGEIVDPSWQRDGLNSWEFDALPERVDVQRGSFVVPGYPALVDRGDTVSLRLLDNADYAAEATRAGLRRLFALAEHKQLKSQVKWLPELNRLQLYASTLGHQQDLRTQLQELIADRAFYYDLREVPRDAEQFEQARQGGRRNIPAATQDVARLIVPLLEASHKVQVELEQTAAAQYAHAVEDIVRQFQLLTGEGFLVETPWRWLEYYPRFFQAIQARLQKLRSGGLQRDQQLTQQLQPYLQQWQQRQDEHHEHGVRDPALTEYRWMLEEFRVSLFAQELGTSIKISPQRLDKQWAKVKGPSG